ncbi:MAG: type II toxin-antitoxin system VapC family toxin [Cyanobacteria bacterium P01_C01_bin.69]
MRLLLDTHSFLWFIQGNKNLSPRAIALIEDPENQKLISTASLWEIAIKVSIGKLEIEMSMTDLVKEQVIGNTFDVLSIAPEHLNVLTALPFHHKDPFDRLIISQSMAESIPVISRDKVFKEYPAQQVW